MKQTLLGAVGAAAAASVCCAGPLVLLLMGFSGAWMSHLAWFAPLRPVLMGLALAALLWVFKRIYYPSPAYACEKGQVCERPQVQRATKIVFWTTSVLVGLLLASPEILVWIYS